jgi:hypothetical protein
MHPDAYDGEPITTVDCTDDSQAGTPIPGWPDEHMTEAAWVLIANVVNWDSPDLTPGWRAAAERWRDAYHRQLAAEFGPSARLEDPL